MAMKILIVIFWVVMLFSLVHGYQHSGFEMGELPLSLHSKIL
jgi:hypothetical protein